MNNINNKDKKEITSVEFSETENIIANESVTPEVEVEKKKSDEDTNKKKIVKITSTKDDKKINKKKSKKSNKNSKNNIHCLNIIGQIEGHMTLPPQNKTTKYEHLLPQLVGIKQDEEVDGVLVLLNTVGGDVEAGLAIAEMISSLGKPVVSLVLGGGHSIGVPLAVAANYSFICKTATMTIHPVRMNGTIIGVQQAYEYFEKMQERISQFVVDHSSISRDRFKELLLDTENMAKDVGTLLGGERAVREGIINEVGGLDKAMEKLNELIDENEC